MFSPMRGGPPLYDRKAAFPVVVRSSTHGAGPWQYAVAED